MYLLNPKQFTHTNNFPQVLHLHKNQIVNLRHCEMFLPGNLEIVTLANNNITDLNEISHLVQLCNLKELSINGNPCVSMTGNNLYPFTFVILSLVF